MRVFHLFQYKGCLLFFILLIIGMDVKGANANEFLLFSAPKYETRAVWLTTFGGLDWPRTHSLTPTSKDKQQQELCALLDKLKEGGINTILLQTRVRASTIYPSVYETWDRCLTGIYGKSPQYDALKFAIEECHKRGMELHAWVVTIPVGKWNQKGCLDLRRKYPRMVKKIGDEGFLNPEYAGTATYLAKICQEIVNNYDVDGIHLDYIRYPELWPNKRMGNTERANITRIVAQIHTHVKKAKPWIKVSCSPIGKYNDLSRYSSKGWNAFSRVAQDAQMWVKTGLIDNIYPMLYFRGNDFYPFLFDWIEQCGNENVAAGLAAYMLSPQEKNWPLEDIIRQLQTCRSRGVGYAFFRARFFTADTKGVFSFVKNHMNASLALTPPMHTGSIVRPQPPRDVILERTSDCDYLSWQTASTHRVHQDGNYTLYNIYASPDKHIDINNPQMLIATRVAVNHIKIGQRKGKIPINYAITAMDRYGNESSAIYVN